MPNRPQPVRTASPAAPKWRNLSKSLPEQISRDRMTVVVTLVILYAAASVLGVLFVATGTRRSRGSKWLKGGPGPIE